VSQNKKKKKKKRQREKLTYTWDDEISGLQKDFLCNYIYLKRSNMIILRRWSSSSAEISDKASKLFSHIDCVQQCSVGDCSFWHWAHFM